MYYVRLRGGMGNQMFQYAFGKALEHRTGIPVQFDLSYFNDASKMIVNNTGRDSSGYWIRTYEIGIFPNLNLPIADQTKLEKLRKNKIPFRKLFGIKKYKDYVPDDSFPYDFYDERLFHQKQNTIFNGYYQNEKYFDDIRGVLLHDFQFPNIRSDDTYNQSLYDKILHTENSVFIQVRREDYAERSWMLPLSYYKSAVEYIRSHINNPHFFVFCAEDPEYIKNNFDIGVPFELVGEKNFEPNNYYENMRLMNTCQHAILANSTYCWWAAYLSDQRRKITIAPSPWLDGRNDIICKNWIKIKNLK